MTRFVLWLFARSLILSAERLARIVGVTAEGCVYLHAGEWSVAPAHGSYQTLTLGGLLMSHPAVSRHDVTVTDVVRCGPAVLAREWTPDGGPCVYVLDASQEADPPGPVATCGSMDCPTHGGDRDRP